LAAPEAVERSHDGRFPPDRRARRTDTVKPYRYRPFVAGRDIRAGCVSHARFDRIYKVFFCAVPENRHLSSTRVRTGGFWGIPAAGWESGRVGSKARSEERRVGKGCRGRGAEEYVDEKV